MANNIQCWTRTAKNGSTYVHCEEEGASSGSSQSTPKKPPVPQPITAQDLERSRLMQMALQAEMRAESLRTGPMTPEKARELAKYNELLIQAFESEMKNPINSPIPLRAEDIYDPPIDPVCPECYLLPGGKILQWIIQGKEFKYGNNIRIAPFGNRTWNLIGQIPHYHRRIVNHKTGETFEGQGIGRHRPYQTSEHDTSFGDRF